jgi:hypothetical protein
MKFNNLMNLLYNFRKAQCHCPIGFFGSPKIRCFPLLRQVKSGAGAGSDGKDVILLSNPEGNSSNGTLTMTMNPNNGNDNGSGSPTIYSFSNSSSSSSSSSEEKFGGFSASKLLSKFTELTNQNRTKISSSK